MRSSGMWSPCNPQSHRTQHFMSPVGHSVTVIDNRTVAYSYAERSAVASVSSAVSGVYTGTTLRTRCRLYLSASWRHQQVVSLEVAAIMEAEKEMQSVRIKSNIFLLGWYLWAPEYVCFGLFAFKGILNDWYGDIANILTSCSYLNVAVTDKMSITAITSVMATIMNLSKKTTMYKICYKGQNEIISISLIYTHRQKTR